MTTQQLFERWDNARKEASDKVSEASDKLNTLYDEQKNNIEDFEIAHHIHLEIMAAHDAYQKAWEEYVNTDELYEEYKKQVEFEAETQPPYVEQDYYGESREMARLQALADWR